MDEAQRQSIRADLRKGVVIVLCTIPAVIVVLTLWGGVVLGLHLVGIPVDPANAFAWTICALIALVGLPLILRYQYRRDFPGAHAALTAPATGPDDAGVTRHLRRLRIGLLMAGVVGLGCLAWGPTHLLQLLGRAEVAGWSLPSALVVVVWMVYSLAVAAAFYIPLDHTQAKLKARIAARPAPNQRLQPMLDWLTTYAMAWITCGFFLVMGAMLAKSLL